MARRELRFRAQRLRGPGQWMIAAQRARQGSKRTSRGIMSALDVPMSAPCLRENEQRLAHIRAVIRIAGQLPGKLIGFLGIALRLVEMPLAGGDTARHEKPWRQREPSAGPWAAGGRKHGFNFPPRLF